jgi:hypothetical protein
MGEEFIMAERWDASGLRGEWLLAELDTYRKIENWGLSLFLAALGFVAKQFYEWEKVLTPSPASALVPKHTLDPWLVGLPALVGLTGFVFLRVVNFRSNRATRRLDEFTRRAAPNESPYRQSLGILGWLFALMPLVFGYAITLYFATPSGLAPIDLSLIAARKDVLEKLRSIISIAVIFFIILHLLLRFTNIGHRRNNRRASNKNS